MQKVCIVYATREGQTQKIANRIAQELDSLGAKSQVYNARELFDDDLSRYDFLLFGASMHAGGIEKELIRFIQRHHEKIESMPRAFFMVSLSAATKDERLRDQWLTEAKQKLVDQLPITFDRVEMIAGALRYSKYSWPVKWIMRRIVKKAGEDTDISTDHEYTDWHQVKRIAASIMDIQ